MIFTHYLTFKLNNQAYGVPIEVVKEISQMVEVTPVPQMAASIIGVMNMRGRIISVVDLRMQFGLETADYTKQSCILVIEVEGQHVGAVVDSVEEVKEFVGDNFEEKPTLVDENKVTHIIGMGKEKKGMVILVNLTDVLIGIKTSEVSENLASEEVIEAAAVAS